MYIVFIFYMLCIVYIMLIYIILFLCIVSVFQIFTKRDSLREFSNLQDDGYVIKHNIISDEILNTISRHWDRSEFIEIDNLIKNNQDIKRFVYNNIPSKEYEFMDYIMFLENTILHTCHRDNNSHHFNNINRSYTVIIYIDDMKNCLDVIPKSQNNKLGLYLYDTTNTFLCKEGSVILFDSSLVHCGSMDSNRSNRRIQLKVSHKSDLENLSFYQNYHKIVNKYNTNSAISKRIQKHISCQFPIISDMTQGKDKSYISGNLSYLTQVFSKLFYSDKDFYKLQDAF